jgi:hypothetical protein
MHLPQIPILDLPKSEMETSYVLIALIELFVVVKMVSCKIPGGKLASIAEKSCLKYPESEFLELEATADGRTDSTTGCPSRDHFTSLS